MTNHIVAQESGTPLIGTVEVACPVCKGTCLKHRTFCFKCNGWGVVIRPSGLAKREFEVFELVVEGKMDKEIAQALGLTFSSAHTSVGVILRKLELRRIEAAVWWTRTLLTDEMRRQQEATILKAGYDTVEYDLSEMAEWLREEHPRADGELIHAAEAA